MAHPKRRTSTTRRDKRRTHFKAVADNIAICPTTVSLTYFIMLIGMKENFTTKEKL